MSTNLHQKRVLRDGLQKVRIQTDNMRNALWRDNQNPDPNDMSVLEELSDWLFEKEQMETANIIELTKQHPLYPYVSRVKGIGPVNIAPLLAEIDIYKARHVSNLWRYCGVGLQYYWYTVEGTTGKNGKNGKIAEGKRIYVAPIRGKKFFEDSKTGEKIVREITPEPQDGWILTEDRVPDRKLAGWVLPYNEALKSDLYVIFTNFSRSHSPYYYYYLPKKDFYLAKGMVLDRAHKTAIRKTMQIFLQHLWITWRTIEGLPVSEPWILENGQHEEYLSPQEFGWPEI